VLVILPARHRHSLGSHEDEDRPSASYSEFSACSAQSGPTRRACRIRPVDLAIDLRGSTRESPFADNRYSRFVFSSLDDLHCQRVDSYVDHPVDYPRLSSRILCVSGAAHLHMPDDHLHFFDVDRLLPELMTFATTAIRTRKSDARTHRTPKALRAKFTNAHYGFAKLLECARVLASLSQGFTHNKG